MSTTVRAALSISQKRIWHSFLSIYTIFALANGTYTSYTFLYLKDRLKQVSNSNGSIIDNLLFILVVSMIFEFFAEPITGDWADTYGRRKVVVGSFLGFTGAFVCYWLISADAITHLPDPLQYRVLISSALLAELLFAASAALFNGALEAWFVDELNHENGPQGAALLPFFSSQRRWVGVFMIVGGIIPLWLTSDVLSGRAAAGSGLGSMIALPWLAVGALTAVAAMWSNRRLVEHQQPASVSEPTHKRILVRLQRVFRIHELRNALFISSVIYTCWICFMYLLPVLLTEQQIIAEAGMFKGVLKSYYWYYLSIGASRFIGPFLAHRIRLGSAQSAQFRWWGVLNCGALMAAGFALLLRRYSLPGISTGLCEFLVPLALILFWITKVAEEAFKPVRSTYLNHLIKDGSDRAFILSLATPFGAVIILVGTGLLIVLQRFLQSFNETQFSISLLFVILGALGSILTVQLSRQRRSDSTLPAASAVPTVGS